MGRGNTNNMLSVVMIALGAALIAVLSAIAAWTAPGIAAGGSSQSLTNGQRWEVAKIISAVVATFDVLLTVGIDRLMRDSIAQVSMNISEERIAARLRADEDFQRSAGTAAPSLPAGTLIFIAGGISVPCPAGFELYTEGAGRFPMMAGAGDKLTPRQIGESGGEERVTLTIDQIPAHSHNTGVVKADGANQSTDRARYVGGNRGEQTSTVGGGQSHNNIPPFIAFQTCKKLSSEEISDALSD